MIPVPFDSVYGLGVWHRYGTNPATTVPDRCHTWPGVAAVDDAGMTLATAGPVGESVGP